MLKVSSSRPEFFSMSFNILLSWYDLRRLNHEPNFQRTLTKEVGTQTFILLPNDSFYILPIIDIEILTYGLEQNP